VVNVIGTDLDPLASILHFFLPVLNCTYASLQFCEAMAGSLSMASTAVSLAKATVVDSGVVGRSPVKSRYFTLHCVHLFAHL
jgi:hypothetical protein